MRQPGSFILFAGACALLLWCGGARTLHAQSQSLGLRPAFIDANVRRGSTYNQSFTIANNTSTRLRFRCSVGDYWYDEKNTRVVGRPGTLPRSASTWVQFAPSEIVIEPNSSGTVKAIINVPAALSCSSAT